MNHNIKDVRGGSPARRARKKWFLDPKSGFGGNGKTVPCYWGCGKRLRATAALEADRYPICGHNGGSYRRENIVPSCRDCNRTRCQGCMAEIRANGGLLSREKPNPACEEY